jgi:hypothetical protein
MLNAAQTQVRRDIQVFIDHPILMAGRVECIRTLRGYLRFIISWLDARPFRASFLAILQLTPHRYRRYHLLHLSLRLGIEQPPWPLPRWQIRRRIFIRFRHLHDPDLSVRDSTSQSTGLGLRSIPRHDAARTASVSYIPANPSLEYSLG